MDYKTTIRRAADHTGERDSETAERLARALAGDAEQVPTIALDFLWRARKLAKDSMPSTADAILAIIAEDS